MGRKILRNERGFTLVEVVAVLIILGILSSIAVPRYFDMQTYAYRSAAQGAASALQAMASQDFAHQVLQGKASANSYSPAESFVNVGDFAGTINANAETGEVTVVVTNGPPWFDDNVASIGTYAEKKFKMFK